MLKIDPTEALNIEGVYGVYTANDVPGINQSPKDKPVLAKDVAKYQGDGVAIVVANTRKQAKMAAKKVIVEYEELLGVFDPVEALIKGAPIVHGDTNFAAQHKTVKGDINKGFSEADVIIVREYSTQRGMHAAMEPDCAIAVPQGDGLLIYCAGKGPFNIKRAVAASCGLEQNQVRLIQPAIGGAFGGKDIDMNVIASRAAIAAMKTNRPCKMIWSREEVLAEGTKRHPFKLKYKVGAKKDGRIVAMEINGVVDVGAYISKSAATIWRATVEATGPYKIPNVSTTIVGAFTNNVLSDAVRGFGSPQVDFASESLMNELAHELNMDPLKLRRMNAFTEGSVTATGQTLKSVNLIECLDKLEETFPIKEKPETATKGTVRGRGISCIFRGEAMGAGFFTKDGATVDIRVEKDGSILVLTGIAEMGQGGGNVVLQMVSEVLGVDIKNIKISPLDTAYVVDSGATVGSRGTITSGNAALEAARDLKSKMTKIISKQWNVYEEDIVFESNNVFVIDKSKSISFKDAVTLCFKNLAELNGHGCWALPDVWWDFEKNQGETYASFTYGACGAEVEIDLVSGKVDVTNLVAVHDAGKVINEPEAKAQIAGGASMGFGLALTEEVVIENGILKTTNFDKYLLPTTLDFYSIKPVALEAKPGTNPLGVKGVGEPSSAAVAPAIINAIENALGVRIRNLPANLESIMAAILESEQKGYIKGGVSHE